MKPAKQLFRHNPDKGEFGDCHRTCLAMLLDMEPHEVPNFSEQASEDSEMFYRLFEDFLNMHGYLTFRVLFGAVDRDDGPEAILNTMKWMNPGVFYILGGRSRTANGHSVVCLNDKIIADPSLDDSGIIGPMSDGYYRVEVLLSTRFQANSEPVKDDPDYVGITDEPDDVN